MQFHSNHVLELHLKSVVRGLKDLRHVPKHGLRNASETVVSLTNHHATPPR